MKQKNNSTFFICPLFIFLVISCTFNYEDANLSDSLDQNKPDIILENAKLIFVRGTEVSISAEKVEIFSNKQQQNMYGITFTEKDATDKIRMEGHSDQIVIETDNNNITMLGNIFARSHKDEAEITTEYLYWNDEERLIEGSGVTPVIVTKDIGSTISGTGFRGDVERRSLTISGAVEGKLVIDEDD